MMAYSKMHLKSLYTLIADRWIVIESWGQWRFVPLTPTSLSACAMKIWKLQTKNQRTQLSVEMF